MTYHGESKGFNNIYRRLRTCLISLGRGSFTTLVPMVISVLWTLSLMSPVRANEVLARQQVPSPPPVASIATVPADLGHVVSVGSTVGLDGTGALSPADPIPANRYYYWDLIKKPLGSSATLALPSPSMPSFAVDEAGLYVVMLLVKETRVGNRSSSSEPAFLLITGVKSENQTVLATKTVRVPMPCSKKKNSASDSSTASTDCLTGESGSGTKEKTFSFEATAGNYFLHITRELAQFAHFTLNSERLHFVAGCRF